MVKVSIITVAYNSSEIIGSLLASVPEGVDIIVVDNASDDGPELHEICTAEGAEYVRSETNLGFGRGCNLGAAQAEGELLFFVNPDAVLEDGCIDHMCDAAASHPLASAFNPLLREKNGAVSFKRRSKLLPRSEWLPRNLTEFDREVPVLSGAALMIRRTAFEHVEGFDPNIFLFHEDDDLSLRLKQQCGPLRLVGKAEVKHLFGHSTKRSAKSAAFKAWYMGQSRVYACRKHQVPMAFTKALFDAFLQAISPVSFLSGRKRAKHISYLKGVIAAYPLQSARLPPRT